MNVILQIVVVLNAVVLNTEQYNKQLLVVTYYLPWKPEHCIEPYTKEITAIITTVKIIEELFNIISFSKS